MHSARPFFIMTVLFPNLKHAKIRWREVSACRCRWRQSLTRIRVLAIDFLDPIYRRAKPLVEAFHWNIEAVNANFVCDSRSRLVCPSHFWSWKAVDCQLISNESSLTPAPSWYGLYAFNKLRERTITISRRCRLHQRQYSRSTTSYILHRNDPSSVPLHEYHQRNDWPNVSCSVLSRWYWLSEALAISNDAMSSLAAFLAFVWQRNTSMAW